MGQGLGPMVPYQASPGFGGPASVALGDLNGDGRLDIVATNGSPATSNNLFVLLGQAGGGLAPVRAYSSGSASPYGLALGDLNGDGRLDVVAVVAGNQVSVHLGQGNGTLAPARPFTTGGNNPGMTSVAVGDVTGDGRPDVVTANRGDQSVGVLTATGAFAPLAAASSQGVTALRCFPNPAAQRTALSLAPAPAARPGQLVDALGRDVRPFVVPAHAATAPLDLQGMAPGVYTVRCGPAATRLFVE